MSRNVEIKRWLNEKFLEWSQEEGERKTIREFSIYLDVHESLLARWMAGKILPGNENVIKLANKLGPIIYDLLEWERPIVYEK